MSIIGPSSNGQFISVPIFNQLVPNDKPKASTCFLNFLAANEYSFDFLQTMWQNQLTMVQGLYFSTKGVGANVTLTIDGTQQTMQFNNNKQGYRPILFPDSDKPSGKFSASGGAGVMQVIFLNVPMPVFEWDAT